MKKNILIIMSLLIFIQCKNQAVIVDTIIDQTKLDDYLEYVTKPDLTVKVLEQSIYVRNTEKIGTDTLEVLCVHWAERDSNLLNDSEWINCHELKTLSCNNTFTFFRKDNLSKVEFPEYIVVEYRYKNAIMCDTIYLDSIAAFLTTVNLTSKKNGGIFEHTILWNNETIENTDMKIKYMEIGIDNGLCCGEYYRSYPNDGTLKDGESDGFEAYRYWHSAFLPEDNFFILKTETSAVSFLSANILVKSYPEYNISLSVTKPFS
jgi:hypothetical protein